jgi:hypothetical protein
LKDRTTITADLKAIAQKKAPDVPLQPYDIIEVPMKSRWDFKILMRSLVEGTIRIFPQPNFPTVGSPRIIR